MKGNNTILLNQAEMVRAIEYYLNNVQFKEPVEVDHISEHKGDSNFVVKVKESGVKVSNDAC